VLCGSCKTNSSFYVRKQNASRVFAIVCMGVCPSVRPSVCLSHSWTVSKRCKLGSLWAAPRYLVYRDKISCHWVQGFPSNEGVEKGYPLKRRHFAVIGSNNLKTVVDVGTYMLLIITSTGDRLFGFIRPNIDDLERP